MLGAAAPLLLGQEAAAQAPLPPDYRLALQRQLESELDAGSAPLAALDFEVSASDNDEDRIQAYLARRIPETLLLRLNDLEFRVLAQDERKAVLAHLHESERAAKLLAWSRSARAAALAELGGSAARPPIQPWQGYFESTPPEAALEFIPETLPIHPLPAGNATQPSPAGGERPGQLEFTSRTAVYLLTGSIQALSGSEDWIWVDYKVWSKYSQEALLSGSFSSSIQSAVEAAFQESRTLAISLGGRSLGSWELLLLPPIYQIRINGRWNGFGTAENDMAAPGDYLVEVFSKGELAEKRVYNLAPGEDAVWIFDARPAMADFVRIESQPAGAEVLIDGRRIGTTPLDAAFLQEERVVSLEAAGFRSWSEPLDSLLRSQGIRAELLDADIDWQAYIDDRRDVLYTALGITALSATVPIVLGGFFSEAYVLAKRDPGNSSAITTANSLLVARNIGLGVFGVGAVVSFITLLDYLDAVRKVTH